MKAATAKGGTAKEIEGEFKRVHEDMLYLKDGDSYVVSFMELPENFTRYSQHSVALKAGEVPISSPHATEGCLVCKKYGPEVTRQALVPLYVYKLKGMRLFRATPTVMSNLLEIHKRRGDKKFIGRKFTIYRDGEGLNTTYSFEIEDDKGDLKKVEKARKIAFVDADKVLMGQMRYGVNQLGLLGGSNSDESVDESHDEVESDDVADSSSDSSSSEEAPKRKSKKDKKKREASSSEEESNDSSSEEEIENESISSSESSEELLPPKKNKKTKKKRS